MSDNQLRNNSPDENKYHQGVPGAMSGTMIPRAQKTGGASLGFDHNKPTVVVVDPDIAGGGFSVDLAAIQDATASSKFNSKALQQEAVSDPSGFYKDLAQLQADAAKAETQTPKKETKMETDPSGHPMENATSIPQPLQPLPPISAMRGTSDSTSAALNALLQEEKEKEEKANYQPATPPPRAPQGTAAADSYLLQQLMAGMAQQRDTINALVAMQTEKAVVAEDIEPEAVEKAPEANPYPQPGIPFLEGDKPQRPQYEIYFEMPKMGTMAARYHSVVEGNACLALIYDTRFEDGFQYLPPSMGEEQISVSVPKLSDKAYNCSSLGLHWTLGCMDVVILIKHGDGE